MNGNKADRGLWIVDQPTIYHPLSIIRGSRGAILIGVLIILLTISLMGATLAAFYLSVTTDTEIELARAQALYLAEAGVAYAIHQMRQAVGIGGQAQIKMGPIPLGEGQFEATNDPTTGLLTASGTVRSVRRTIQVRYVPF